MTADPPTTPEDEAQRRLWPALWSEAEITAGAEALPAPDIPLAPFLAPIKAEPGRTWPRRERSLPMHFRALEPEFAGTPRLAHLLAAVIVVLRREPASAPAQALFRRLTVEHGQTLAAAMNLRWLTSVCDTFCDLGTPVERATALTGTMLSGLVKLAETERRQFHPPRAWPPAARLTAGGLLFDGVISYWVTGGEMIGNMLDRAEAVLADANAATPFVREVIGRLAVNDTVLRRMIEVNDGREIPLAPKARRDAARAAMRDL